MRWCVELRYINTLIPWEEYKQLESYGVERGDILSLLLFGMGSLNRTLNVLCYLHFISHIMDRVGFVIYTLEEKKEGKNGRRKRRKKKVHISYIRQFLNKMNKLIIK